MFPELAADRAHGPLVPSVFHGDNADLIAAVAPLYLTGSVLDVTYGRGRWWQRFQPEPFTFHDLNIDGVDFRRLPEADASIDAVTFDPPYVFTGGVGRRPDFQDRYGIGQARVGGVGPQTTLILTGLVETCRVARQWILVKCMESGAGPAFIDLPHLITSTANQFGWIKHDQIVHYTGSGPGGHNIIEPRRARRMHSYLLVFRPRSRRGQPQRP